MPEQQRHHAAGDDWHRWCELENERRRREDERWNDRASRYRTLLDSIEADTIVSRC
jgi:hypothetical protein